MTRFNIVIRGMVLLVALMHGLPAAADEVEKVVFLFVDGDEVIASNSRAGVSSRLKLQAKERVQEYLAANAVAVVITNQRYLGFGGLSGGWQGIRTRAGETFESVQAEDYSATLVTSDRILTFYAKSGAWNEIRRSEFSFD